MQCLTDTGSGNYVVTNPQPTQITDCVYLLAQPNELPTAFMNMTVEEGLEVGGLLSLVLLAGFTFRAVGRALSTYEKGNENE